MSDVISFFINFSGTAAFSGLALNVLQRKLYYTDSNNGLIGEMSLDGSGRRSIIFDSNSQPRAIIFDRQSRSRYMNLTLYMNEPL
jgi:hypothetical protein